MTLTQARIAFLANEWREASSTDAGVQTAHLLAPQVVEESCLVVEADAIVELNDDTDELDLGDVITLTHSRYGLSAGKQFTILDVQPNAREHTVTLTLWG